MRKFEDMCTFEFAKAFIAKQQYRILEEDLQNLHIAFRYQMNTIHFWGNLDDEHFFLMVLPGFTDVTEENMWQVKEKCHRINKEAKLVKLYVLNDTVLFSVEAYYLAEDDFRFQMTNALKHLVAAKVMYKKSDE